MLQDIFRDIAELKFLVNGNGNGNGNGKCRFI